MYRGKQEDGLQKNEQFISVCSVRGPAYRGRRDGLSGGKLEAWLDLETETASYLGSSAEHGLDKGQRSEKVWCCEHEGNIWERREEEPPCEICPWFNFRLTDENKLAVQIWRHLDITGRDRGFGETPVREEAVDAILNRYQVNSPVFYEKILQIDLAIFSHRQDKEQRKRDRDKQLAKSKAKVSRGRS